MSTGTTARYVLMTVCLLMVTVVMTHIIDQRPNDVCPQYGGIFFTEEELKLQTLKYRDIRSDFLISQGYTSRKMVYDQDDGDSCCPTSITYKMNVTMTDITGVSRTIVQASNPTAYQLIPHATCQSENDIACKGRCLIEPSFINLLVYGTGGVMEFAWFMVPGYCSCKNISYP